MTRVPEDVEGAIDYLGDSDYFRFTAERGQFYQIDVVLGSLPDSVLVLLGPDGLELTYNDDYGDSWASRILWEAPESGDYYLVVEANGSADVGTYTLTVSHSTIVDDHGNDIDSATVTRVPEDVEGAIDYLGDSDYFRFTAERGQFYQIDVVLGSLPDSVLVLLGPDGLELTYNDDYGDSWASRILWEAPESGDYYLVVEANGSADVGTYTLTVSHIVDDKGDDIDDDIVAPEQTPLSLDEYLSRCATTDVELADDATFGDYSSLIAAQADRLDALTPPAQLSEWHLLWIESFRTIQAVVDIQPKDDVIDFANFLLIAAASADLEEKLSEAAARLPEDLLQQMIEAGCIDPDVVPDDLEGVSDDHGDDIYDATVALVAVDVEGVINSQYDSDYFRFTAVDGRLYQIDVGLGTLDDSVLLLLGPDGLELTFNDDYGDSLASRIFWEAPESGAYYLEVRGYDVGSYTLTVSLPIDDIDDGTIVDDHGDDIYDATVAPVGVDVEGFMSSQYDTDYFRFTAEEGRLYQIDVSLGTLENSAVYLYDGDGWFLYHNDDHGDSLASRIFWLAPASGDYYLEVLGHDGAGSYTLTISHSAIVDDHGNDVEEATVVEVAVDVEGVIDYSGDSDYFRFTAVDGRLYQIDVSLGTLDNSFLTLLGPDGRALTHNDDNGDSLASRIFWLAPASGDYYLEVEANVWSPGWRTEVGSYTLTVTRP